MTSRSQVAPLVWVDDHDVTGPAPRLITLKMPKYEREAVMAVNAAIRKMIKESEDEN